MWVWRDDSVLGTRTGAASDPRGRGWTLDASGTWTWAEPSPLEREGAGVGALRGLAAPASIPAARLAGSRRAEPWYGPAAVAAPALRAPAAGGRTGDEPTPIFHELTVDRTRRGTPSAVAPPVIPEPHPGSGPLPVQDPHGARRGLVAVPTVPPPPGPGDHADHADHAGHAGHADHAGHAVTPSGRRGSWIGESRAGESWAGESRAGESSGQESPEDELRRRAERRRRPRSEEASAGSPGHSRESTAAAARGRHALRPVEPTAGRHSLR